MCIKFVDEKSLFLAPTENDSPPLELKKVIIDTMKFLLELIVVTYVL